MLSTIIKKEWAEYKGDYRLRAAAIALYALFAVALFTGIRYYLTTTKASEAAQTASYNQWLAQGKKNPHGAAHYGFYAFKPLSPMAVIDKGMEGYLGQAVWLEAHNQNEAKEREATDAGSIVRFGYLSVGFLFQFLLPLAILLIGFNAFSKEREWGTLPLLLSSEMGVAQLLKGKAMALYRVALLLFLPMLFLSCAAMLFAAGFNAWLAVLPQFLLFSLLSLLYLAVWVLLSLYVSTFARQSSVALVALLGFWVAGAFFVPRMGGVLAKAFHPTPSSFAFSHAVRLDNELGLDRKTPASLRQKRFEDSLLKRYAVDSLSKLPLNIRGLNLKRGEDYGYLIFEKNYGGLEETYRQQSGVMNWLNLLSPAQAARSISAGLSGTDMAKQTHFAALAEEHRRLIAATMNEDIAANSVGIENYEVEPSLWKKVPPFRYREASLTQVLEPQAVPILSLLLWCGLLAFLLKRRAKKITGL